MTAPTLLRYEFDSTGINKDNFVKGEPHTLADKRFRAIAPDHGAFYTRDFKIVEAATKRELLRGVDFVFAELYQSLTLELGVEVAGVAIVINTQVSSDVIIDYQCVGGDFSIDNGTLIGLLEKSSDNEISKSYIDIDNKPSTFVPSPHLHDLGDVFGLEPVVYALERLRNAIVWSNSAAIDSAIIFVRDRLDNLARNILNRVENEFLSLILDYKQRFTKELIGLSLLKNYPMAIASEGGDVFNENYKVPVETGDKYVGTRALIGFKEILYSAFLSSELTNLGKSYGLLVRPTLRGLNDILPGTSYLLDTIRAARLAAQEYDLVVYPNQDQQDQRWTITKVINKPNSQGGIFLAVNNENGDLYTGQMNISSTGIITLQWARHMNGKDAEGFSVKLIEHINDFGNPHKTKKRHILLSDVENLPVATKSDIVCRKPIRKYITYDGLLLFMKAFLTGIKGEEDINQDDESPSVLEKYQTIFAPCGPCGSLQAQPPRVICDERGKLILTYCDTNFVKKSRFADGDCGFYDEVLEENSAYCGWKAPEPLPEPEKRFALGWYFNKTYIEPPEEYGGYGGYGGYYENNINFDRSIANVVEYLSDEDARPNDDALRFYCDGPPQKTTAEYWFDDQNSLAIVDLDKNYAKWFDNSDNIIPTYTENFGVDDGFWKEGYTIKVLPRRENELDLMKYLKQFNLSFDPATGTGSITFTNLTGEDYIAAIKKDYADNTNNPAMIEVLNSSFPHGSNVLDYIATIETAINGENWRQLETVVRKFPLTPKAHLRIGVFNEKNELKGWLLFFTTFHDSYLEIEA